MKLLACALSSVAAIDSESVNLVQTQAHKISEAEASFEDAEMELDETVEIDDTLEAIVDAFAEMDADGPFDAKYDSSQDMCAVVMGKPDATPVVFHLMPSTIHLRTCVRLSWANQ